jgi:hypothetical protein
MNRRTFLQGTLPAAALSRAPAPRLPNALLFCTDQQRFDTIHSLGNPHIRTPKLEFHNLWNDPGHKALWLELTDQLFNAWMLVTDPGQRRIAMS